MEGISRTMFAFLVIVVGFAGIGVLHVLQITGMVKVQVSIDPNTWDYAPEVKQGRK